jgi:hypothetical protein
MFSPGSSIICFTFCIHFWPIYWLSLLHTSYSFETVQNKNNVRFLRSYINVRYTTSTVNACGIRQIGIECVLMRSWVFLYIPTETISTLR